MKLTSPHLYLPPFYPQPVQVCRPPPPPFPTSYFVTEAEALKADAKNNKLFNRVRSFTHALGAKSAKAVGAATTTIAKIAHIVPAFYNIIMTTHFAGTPYTPTTKTKTAPSQPICKPDEYALRAASCLPDEAPTTLPFSPFFDLSFSTLFNIFLAVVIACSVVWVAYMLRNESLAASANDNFPISVFFDAQEEPQEPAILASEPHFADAAPQTTSWRFGTDVFSLDEVLTFLIKPKLTVQAYIRDHAPDCLKMAKSIFFYQTTGSAGPLFGHNAADFFWVIMVACSMSENVDGAVRDFALEMVMAASEFYSTLDDDPRFVQLGFVLRVLRVHLAEMGSSHVAYRDTVEALTSMSNTFICEHPYPADHTLLMPLTELVSSLSELLELESELPICALAHCDVHEAVVAATAGIIVGIDRLWDTTSCLPH